MRTKGDKRELLIDMHLVEDELLSITPLPTFAFIREKTVCSQTDPPLSISSQELQPLPPE